MYYREDSQHEALLSMNPNITFTLGNSIIGDISVDIVLPYASFDLLQASPAVESPTRVFPLRRAANGSQYTVGRTFLQEAYVWTYPSVQSFCLLIDIQLCHHRLREVQIFCISSQVRRCTSTEDSDDSLNSGSSWSEKPRSCRWRECRLCLIDCTVMSSDLLRHAQEAKRV